MAHAAVLPSDRAGWLCQRLRSQHPFVLAMLAGTVAFGAYTCMYAFRKPYTATDFAGFQGIAVGSHTVTFKTLLVMSQVLGYALSKFLGIKVVSETTVRYREVMILGLIGIAELALLGFAFVPAPWNAIFLFCNGLPLGMIWGLVFSYLEGRRMTEVMGLILCASFIFSSALVKDCGAWLLGQGITERWMPFMTGLMYAPFLVIFVWFLRQLPPPSLQDEAMRTPRAPMNRTERIEFFTRFAFGLVVLVIVYTALTAFRDFRDNFQSNILVDLRGVDHNLSFGNIEQYVMYGVLPALMLLVTIRSNALALWVNHLVVFAGVATVGAATWAFQRGWISDMHWWVLTGIGGYLAYIPFNCILFERLIATFRRVANVGFLIYVADAFGYLGSIMVMVYKDVVDPQLKWSEFFAGSCYMMALSGMVGTLASLIYFARKYRRQSDAVSTHAGDSRSNQGVPNHGS